jgi:glycosyltransferase involved in cell wall biosynthesis
MLPAGSIVLDAQGAQSPHHRERGIARYTVEQIRGVLELAPDAVRAVALNPRLPMAQSLDFLLGREILQWADPQQRPSAGPPGIWHAVSPFELLQPGEAIWPRWARGRETRLVLTLYDLIPLLFAERYLQDPALNARYRARANLVRAAHGVLAISQTTAADAEEHLGVDPRRITVIDAGVTTTFAAAFAGPEAAWQVLAERLGHVRDGFLLYVGGIDFRKNIPRLIEAHALLPAEVRARHQLVIVCRVEDETRRELEELSLGSGARPGELLLAGFVTDDELAALYHVCRLFVFASFYEGSGLPILEAMTCGAPVVASNTSTSPEILGDGEGTFDPFDVADMARVLEENLGSDARLERLRERSRRRADRFTWARVAQKTVEGYDAALGAGNGAARRRVRATRARTAWVTPWPPERSGIAAYNQRLLPALAEECDVDVVVARGVEEYVQVDFRGGRMVPARALDWNIDLREYDRLVHCMGNSHFHRHTLEALERHGGAVVAHDVRFVGFYGWLGGEHEPDDPWGWLAHRLGVMYGQRVDVGEFRDRPPTPEEQERLGLYMTHELQRAADQVLVHSAYAADVVRLDAPADLATPPRVDVIPLAFPTRDPGDVRREDALIATFGVLSSVKGLARLIDAFALVHSQAPRARLVLAGGADDVAEEQRWRAYAARAGVGDAVEVTGYLDEPAYEDLLRRCTIAVQLRETSNGEASAAVTDCLSMGTPTIVTDHGWARELPTDTIARVPRTAPPTLLAARLLDLLDDPDARRHLGAAGLEHARGTSFGVVAQDYWSYLT